MPTTRSGIGYTTRAVKRGSDVKRVTLDDGTVVGYVKKEPPTGYFNMSGPRVGLISWNKDVWAVTDRDGNATIPIRRFKTRNEAVEYLCRQHQTEGVGMKRLR